MTSERSSTPPDTVNVNDGAHDGDETVASRPTVLRGRRLELATLNGMLADMVEGRARHLSITGPSGIGKSALARTGADWIRERDGHFAHGKFDQYQSLSSPSAPLQAAAALAEALLAGTAASLALWQDRLTEALMPQSAGLACLHPSLGALLGPLPQTRTAARPLAFDDTRLPQALASFFATVARVDAPLVLVLDDVQWADAASLAFVDALLRNTELRFLMLIVTARGDAAIGTQALPLPIRRWGASPPRTGDSARKGGSVSLEDTPVPLMRHMALAPLDRDDVTALLADALRVLPEQVQALCRPVMDRTLGNPYHVLELARTLSRHATAAPAGSLGWAASLQTRLGVSQHDGLATLLRERLLDLPRTTRALLQIAASLGNEFSLATLAAATLRALHPSPSLARQLQRLVDIGVLDIVGSIDTAEALRTLLSGETRFAFRHDRMQQAVVGLVEETRRRATHLHIARALARRPGGSASPQDLWAAGPTSSTTPHSPELQVASHFAEALPVLEDADRATALGHFVAASRLSQHAAAPEQALRYLDLARAMVPPGDPRSHRQLLLELAQSRHAALCGLGRHAEADFAYEQLIAWRPAPEQLLVATSLQVASLYGRQRTSDALALGLSLLRGLDVDVPTDFGTACVADFERFRRLCDERPLEDLIDAPAAEPALDALHRFLGRLSYVAVRVDRRAALWLSMQPCLAWFRQGFTQGLCSAMGGMMVTSIALGDDYALGERALRLGLAAARRGLASQDASALHELQALHGLHGAYSHWFAPLEEAVEHSREALRLACRQADLRCRIHDLQALLPASLDIVTNLDQAGTEIDAAWALATTLRSRDHLARFATWRQFLRAMRGQTFAPGSFDDADFDEASYSASTYDDDDAVATFHGYRAFSAALFGDDAAVVVHAAKALRLLDHSTGTYPCAIGVTMAGLGTSLELARIDPRDHDRRDALLHRLDHHAQWMADRAARAPRNFAHLHHYLTALRCAARAPQETAQFEPAMRAFDLAARTAVASGRRLHAAFLLEQAAHFHLDHGLPTSAQELLGLALEHHAAWGTTGKVEQMRARWPQLAAASMRQGDATTTTDDARDLDVDRLAILKASQALSSVTDYDGLVKRIVTVIAQVSGATDVGLFIEQSADPDVFDDGPLHELAEPSRWTLVAVARVGQPVMALHESAAMAGSCGFSASLVRHALRSLRPESIDDIRSDPRMRRGSAERHEPAGSALLLPVLSRGRPRALLLIENRLAPRFFPLHRLATLELLCGQIATSLQNAMLHRSMEDGVSRRTRELKETMADLVLRDRALAAVTEAVSILDAKADNFAAVHVNPAFEALTGYAAHEVLGRSLYRLYGNDTAQPGIHELRNAIRLGVETRATVRCYRKGGEMFWNEVSVAPVVDDEGRVSHHVCVNVDVTQRLQRAAAERLCSERLQAVFELGPDGVVVLDASQRVISANPAFKAMTGMEDPDLIGLSSTDFEAALTALGDGGRTSPGPPERPASLRLLRPEPRVLRRHTRRAVHGEQDTVLYFRDVTREAEADKMKSEFLATAAHELRTPMTSVSALTERLLDPSHEASLRIELLKVVHRQTAALTSLLDKRFDLANIEAGSRASVAPHDQPQGGAPT